MNAAAQQIDRAWDILAEHAINRLDGEPKECPNNGEVWQLMGVGADGGYQFRHRCHPILNARAYLTVYMGGTTELSYRIPA